MQFNGDQRSQPGPSTIYVVDDDPLLCTSLMDLFESAKMPAVSYSSGDEFIARADLERAGCILLDVYMPGVDGFQIQQHMADLRSMVPIVFMTGRATIPLSVQAMKRGACDFLLKPLDRDEVISATGKAVGRNAVRRAQAAESENVYLDVETLSPREKQVMDYVVRGYLNKDIARELSVSEMMIKLHRSRMMKKMRTASLPDLVKKIDLLQRYLERTL
ncbi:response regulator transcription factor [Rhizobium sp. GR12]|uniref:response regulator transcription factor n=1 Tax=Rhizobium sp. GR12 TaxID=3053925 RepID=UPI002FBECCF9